MILSVADTISELIKNGLEIILNPPGGIATIIIQLVATLLLFLAVRFLLWGKITAVLEERKQKMEDAFKQKEDAIKDALALKEKMLEDEKASKDLGYQIIEKAKQKSYLEADEIIAKAKNEAKNRLDQAEDEIKIERAKAEDEIKKEIIDVAYLMAEKIVSEEIKKGKYDNLVDDFRKKVEKDTTNG